MLAHAAHSNPIGPTTEARIATAFAKAAVIGGEAACALIGCSLKTLNELADAGAIRAVRKGGGKTRGYTEGDIRAYLTQSAGPERQPAPKVPGRTETKVLPFSQRKKARRC